jgi:hypothetical protein
VQMAKALGLTIGATGRYESRLAVREGAYRE